MFKKLFLFLIILSMTLVLFTGVPIGVSAEEVASGGCGSDGVTDTTSNVKWSLDGSGLLTISGTGDMYNYTYTYADNLPWCNSRSAIKSVVIENGVTSIGGYAFIDCSNLTSVKIPSTVKYIGIQTFANCSGLTSITIPKSESATYIGGNAFAYCSKLKTLFYPDTCNLHENAFNLTTAALIKYTVNNGNVTISAITDKNGNNISGTVEIPTTINGKPVVAVAKEYRGNVDTTNHTTHTGGTATCEEKAECDICGTEYGALAAHNYENGVCTVCGASDPNAGTTPTVTTGESGDDTSTTTETTTGETDNTGTTVTDPTETDGTDPAGTTASTGTTGSSSAWWEPAPVFTTSSTVTTTVTTTVAADNEIIYGDDTGEDTGEDISAGAGAYEENSEIFNGLIAFAFLTVLAISAVLIKKLIS